MSYRFAIPPHERSSAEFIASVRDEIVAAFVRRKKDCGLTQEAVAEATGIGGRNRSIISRIFRGKQNLTLRSVAALAHALGTTIEFRLTDKADPVASRRNTYEGSYSIPSGGVLEVGLPPVRGLASMAGHARLETGA